MHGWRARIGYVCHSVVAETVPYEFYRIAPPGVTMAITTLAVKTLVAEEMARQDELSRGMIEEQAENLARRGVDLIAVTGTPIVFSMAQGYDKELIQRLEARTKLPVITSLTAALEAFKALSARKVVVVSPHEARTDTALKGFLEGAGFEVVKMQSLNPQDPGFLDRVHSLPLLERYRAAKAAFLEAEEADVLYIPGGQLPTLDFLPQLERDMGKPVVSTVVALSWWAFQRLHIREPMKGYGQLLEMLSA